MKAALVAVLVVLGTGCATMSTLGTPTTVAPGKTVWSVAPEVSYAGPRQERLLVPAPEIAVAARRGITEDLDAGVKISGMPLGKVLTTVAVEGSSKYSLYKGKEDSRWDIAAAGALGYRWVTSSKAHYHGLHATLPIYFGIEVGKLKRNQIVFGPRVGVQVWMSEGMSPLVAPFAGSSLGFVWRTKKVTILPEIALQVTPTGLDKTTGTVMMHSAIGFIWE